ncbi:hypothetical protein VIGAN_03137800 [Vigna angularis var. angularis]|uniref:Uncharacterized protein n=1 Tax=Vigna angularis var. angularis TaxID=157739 RepID=A0A0S3RM06_PHAAN|nr:hypothetical protein VIGAN_03137800 [Vigna angularis var. angularis]
MAGTLLHFPFNYLLVTRRRDSFRCIQPLHPPLPRHIRVPHRPPLRRTTTTPTPHYRTTTASPPHHHRTTNTTKGPKWRRKKLKK